MATIIEPQNMYDPAPPFIMFKLKLQNGNAENIAVNIAITAKMVNKETQTNSHFASKGVGSLFFINLSCIFIILFFRLIINFIWFTKPP